MEGWESWEPPELEQREQNGYPMGSWGPRLKLAAILPVLPELFLMLSCSFGLEWMSTAKHYP